jgi:nitrite reductase/ring-hydroxylating ferredoxin subunit
MAETERVICTSDALVDSGLGVHYVAEHAGTTEAAFVVRFEGQVHAYVNRCPHRQTYLHSNIGHFFESEGLLLRCPVHGATFLPDSGKCVSGPCIGSSLIPLAVEERDGKVIVKDSAQADPRRVPGSRARRKGAKSNRK